MKSFVALALVALPTVSLAQGSPTCPPLAHPMFEFQVSRPAQWIADTALAFRPAASGSNVADIVQFIVDSAGIPESGTLKVLQYGKAEFIEGVRRSFTQWRFTPAISNRCKVPQLVQTAVTLRTPGMGENRAADAENAKGITSVVGCYIARPALTYSATGEPEHGDSSWAYVNFLPNGVVRRPRIRSFMDRKSAWTLNGDSLTVKVSDGLAGWLLHLIRVSGGFNGTATYLSDALVPGQQPLTRPITLTNTPGSCANLSGNDRVN